MSVFGYPTKAAFEAAIDQELAQQATHEHHGELLPGRERPTKKRSALRGAPGSEERLEQVAALGGEQNRHLIHEVVNTLNGEEVFRAVKEVQRNPSPQAIQDAADMVALYDDVNVARAAIQALSPTGYGDQFVSALHDSAQRVEALQAEMAEEPERQRLEDRQRLLHSEFQRMSGRPFIEEAVTDIAQAMGDDLYDPALSDEDVQVTLRTQGEMARGQLYALNSFNTLAGLDEEFRRYGPAGRDEDREKWENELRAGTLEVYDRHMPTPNQAVDAAVESVARDKEIGDRDPLEAALDQEIANAHAHSEQAPHKVAAREANVRDWEGRYDSAGRLKK